MYFMEVGSMMFPLKGCNILLVGHVGIAATMTRQPAADRQQA